MKKGQGLSLNTIIIAALALLVLVIIALIFTGKIGGFGQGVSDCERSGYTCEEGTSCPDEKIVLGEYSCPETEEGVMQICCGGV